MMQSELLVLGAKNKAPKTQSQQVLTRKATRRSNSGVTVEDTPSKEKESIEAVLGIYFLNLNAESLMMLNGFG